MATVTVLPTGTCNLASVTAALRRCGADVEVSGAPRRIRDAPSVVLPGVGTFAAAMEVLSLTGADDALRQRAEADRPLLAICVGLQVLGTESEESPGVRGLGIVEGRVLPLGGGRLVRRPQMNWNRVQWERHSGSVTDGVAYFANSFAMMDAPRRKGEACATAWFTYGVRSVAAFTSGSLLACQFHPELSAHYGASILRTFLLGKGGVCR